MSGGVAGLILSYSLLVCDSVAWLIRVATDVEKAVVAAERIEEYTQIESEAPWTVENGPVLDGNWPHNGEITLVNYSTRYRWEEHTSTPFHSLEFGVQCNLTGTSR